MLQAVSRTARRYYASRVPNQAAAVCGLYDVDHISKSADAPHSSKGLREFSHHCFPRWPPACPGINVHLHQTNSFKIADSQVLKDLLQGNRCFSSSPLTEARVQGPDGNGASGKVVLYRGIGMIPFRVLVRLKIFQLAGVAALAIPINTFLVQGSVSSVQAVMATALVVGCAAASVTLWYYSRRYVGEMSLLQRPGDAQPSLCFSVLDFWGNREDNIVPAGRLIAPLQGCSQTQLTEIAEQTLLPIDVEGDRQYILSLRHGHLVNKQKLMEVLKGRWSREQTGS